MVKALADQLRSIDVNIEDEHVYMVLLMSLPPSFDKVVTSLESMSTKDVDLQFIVLRLLHEVSKRKESESKENATLLNKTHKANEKLCFYCKKPGHFVRNCLKKKSDEKEKANQACDDQEQMFVTALSANDHARNNWIKDGYKVNNVHGTVVAQAQREKNLYLLNVNVLKESANVAKSSNEGATLWHQRFGHLNMVSLKKLENMVNGMNLKEVPLHHVCEACIESKHQRTSFSKDEASRASKLLELVHSDVCGPMKTTSRGGA
jgi:hypothetical protein